MIVVRIWGGLGNQMFQYAFGYAMAKKHDCPLYLDTRFYGQKHSSWTTDRLLGLLKFPIEYTEIIASPYKISLFLPFLQSPIVNYAIRRFLPRKISLGKYTYVKEDKLEYIPCVLIPNKSDIYYDGYWHSAKYFDEYRRDLENQFVVKDDLVDEAFALMSEDWRDAELVAVHIRRGDYITQNNPNAMGEDYYKSAIEACKKRVRNPVFCFFSDDLQWVSDKFKDVPNAIMANADRKLDDMQELQLMQRCHHQIISNSSYSWWAAWLNGNPHKIVIAPMFWKNKKDMMPDEWLRI